MVLAPRRGIRAFVLALPALAVAACQPPPPVARGDAGTKGAPAHDAAADFGGADGAAPGAPVDARVCPSPILEDTFAPRRAACAFRSGAMPTETLPLSEPTRAAIPIKHVVVLMKENRAFDHLLGNLHSSGQPDTEAIPASFTNRDKTGAAVAPFRLETTCVNMDPGHQWNEMHRQTNHGAMDGFVTSGADSTGSNGHFAIGNYTAEDVPFYYWLASTYALNDRHFPSVLSGTWPNRNFLMFATSDGVFCSYCGVKAKSTTPSIFDRLDDAGTTWGAYSDGEIFDGTLDWTPAHTGVHPFHDFLRALADGTLPAVSFVDSIGWVEDEHPTADVQVGEVWTRLVYEAAVASPLWPSLALVWTYDEAGGFADHVPPPEHACIARPGNPEDAPFAELGIRVPLVVISPWARPRYVSHVVQDHTAITRLIETVFNLPALTSRDANSPAMLDLFDFDCAPALLRPPEPPAAGSEGCHGEIVLSPEEPTFASAPGLKIAVHFRGVPTPNARDRIGIYKYPRADVEVPSDANPLAPLAWGYIGGGGRAPGSAPMTGEVELDAAVATPGATWPLSPGLYIAYYLPATAAGADGFMTAGSALIELVPPR